MGGDVIYREANLEHYPSIIPEARGHHVSVGDLHGNALKLIYILIEEGILELRKEHYDCLIDIYYKSPEELTQKDLDVFHNVMAHAQVNLGRSLTLIGDELADRGSNDYFSLLVLKKLHDAEFDFDILISNHSLEFFSDYDKRHFTGRYTLIDGQGQSLTNMHSLIKNGLIKEINVRYLVKTCYKDRLKAIGYTLSPEGDITLFTHAPIGLETIAAIASKLKIPYDDRSPRSLIVTINAINEQLQYYFKHNQLSTIINKEFYPCDNDIPISINRPLYRLVWNRALGNELRTIPSLNNYKVTFVHGHIGEGTIQYAGQNSLWHQNLDTNFGKGLKCIRTSSAIHHCTRQTYDFSYSQLAENSGALITTITHRHDSLISQYESNSERRQIIQIKSEKLTQRLTSFVFKDHAVPFYPLAQDADNLLNTLNTQNNAYLMKNTTDDDYDKTLSSLNKSFFQVKTLYHKQVKFLHCLEKLETQFKKITIKAKKNTKEYEPVLVALLVLINKLGDYSRAYFKLEGMSDNDFERQCADAVKEAEPILKPYRGTWFKLSLTVREGIGIFALIPLIPCLPAFLNKSFRERYNATFFRMTPPTGSFKKLEEFKKDIVDLQDIEPQDSKKSEFPSDILCQKLPVSVNLL